MLQTPLQLKTAAVPEAHLAALPEAHLAALPEAHLAALPVENNMSIYIILS